MGRGIGGGSDAGGELSSLEATFDGNAIESTDDCTPPNRSITINSPLTALSCGNSHAVASTVEGTLYLWGNNTKGQCMRPILEEEGGQGVEGTPTTCNEMGNATINTFKDDGGGKASPDTDETTTTTTSTFPSSFIEINPTPSTPISESPQPFAYRFHPPPTTVSGVSCGSNHTLLWCSVGNLYTWGSNTHGQLGHHDLITTHEPRMCEFGIEKTIVGACGGMGHSLALTLDGRVYSWGRAGEGQLGDPTHMKRTTPLPSSSYRNGRNCITKVVFYRDKEDSGDLRLRPSPMLKIVQLAASFNGHCSYAISEHGVCYKWGLVDGEEGTDSDVERVPRKLVIKCREGGGSENVVAVSAGSRHAVCVTDNGLAWSFGAAGPWLGVGPSCKYPHPNPTQILFPTPVLVNGVSCGAYHTVLTTTSGKILTCGKAEFGRLGLSALTLPRSSDPSCAVPQVASLPPPPPLAFSVTETAFTTASKAITQQKEARRRSGDEEDPEWTSVPMPNPDTPPSQPSSKRPRRKILIAAGSLQTFVSTDDVDFY